MQGEQTTMQTVFVYGTLRAGEVNDIRHAAARNEIAAPNLLGTATVRGHLFDFGSYPGLVIDEAGVDVVGDVYEIDDELVAVLDEIEAVYPGVEDRFLAREVMVKVDGDVVNCRFYPVAPNAVKGLPEIKSGDCTESRDTRSKTRYLTRTKKTARQAYACRAVRSVSLATQAAFALEVT